LLKFPGNLEYLRLCDKSATNLYLIDFNFNIFCGTPNDIWRRSSVQQRIVWGPLD